MTMSTWTIALLFSPLVAAAAQPKPAGRGHTPIDGGDLLAPWVAMWNSYDLEQVDELFVTDTTVTYFSSERPGLIRGIDALRAHHVGFGFVKGGKAQTNKLWVEDARARPLGDGYVVTATWFFRRGDGSNRVQRGPMTFVYARSGGRYRIAHGHFANDPPER